MTAIPAVSDSQQPTSFTFLEQIWSPAGAPNPAGADAFIAFMYSDTAADIFAKYGAIQPIPGVSDKLEGDSKTFYSIYDNGATAVMGGFVATTTTDVSTSVEYFDPVNLLVAGELTVDQWLEGIKAANTALGAGVEA